MLRFDWNSLGTGDDVLVHDPTGRDAALVRGVVTQVERRSSKGRANAVGIRVADGEGHRVLWPSYLTVHRGLSPVVEACWRCDG